MDRLSILQLSLHGSVVGHLAGYSYGKNILLFDDEFRHTPERPTLSLITHPNFPNAEEILARDWSKHQRLHPLLSNLLPEGALRELLAHSLKTHIDHGKRAYYCAQFGGPKSVVSNFHGKLSAMG